MSTTTDRGASPIAPEVRLFLARVRHELADLDPEEVAEMTDGLEADLTELVAERGAAALGSPVEYADELRAAAGLQPQVRRPLSRRAMGDRVSGWLDAAPARFCALVDRLPGDQRPLLAWLRPLWWIARGWLAAQLVDWTFHATAGQGGYDLTVIPHMRGLGVAVVVLAVLVSVQVGRGRIWPGGHRGLTARLVLLGLNALAVLVVPVFLSGYETGSDETSASYMDGYDRGYSDGQGERHGSYGIDQQAGIYSSGRWVTNIFPYDAAGKPLVGVQLFDQDGTPIDVVAAPECPDGAGGWSVTAQGNVCYDPARAEDVPGRVPYPWTNGTTQLENVFPLPARMQVELVPSATAFAEKDPPAIGAFPLASVPPVSLPGVTPSRQAAAKALPGR